MRVHEMTAIDLARAYAARDLAPKEVIDSLLMRIVASDATVNAVLGCDTDAARHAADASGYRYRRGYPLSVLDGVPLLVKDNIDTAHLRTTYGSALFREHVPSHDANVVRIARDRGLIILAKTNLNEFAWGSPAPTLTTERFVTRATLHSSPVARAAARQPASRRGTLRSRSGPTRAGLRGSRRPTVA